MRVQQTPPPAIATPEQFPDAGMSPSDQEEIVAATKATPPRKSPGRKQSQQASIHPPAQRPEDNQDGVKGSELGLKPTAGRKAGDRKSASAAGPSNPSHPKARISSRSRDHSDSEEKDEEFSEGADDEPFQPSPDVSPQRPQPKRKSVTKRASSNAKQTPAREDSEQDDDSDHDLVKGSDEPVTPGNAILSPGFDNRRLKKSIKKKPAHDSDFDDDATTRRSARRRWPVLAYWKGERVLYTEEGAKRAEIVGVLTPDLEPHRRKVRLLGLRSKLGDWLQEFDFHAVVRGVAVVFC
jgi:hypothetical protein